jgi:hypothetical protein
MDEQPPRRRLRFGLRTLFELIAVVAFILALIYARRPAEEKELGRYQLQVIQDQSNPLGSQQWVIDTVTGDVWRLNGGQWKSRGPAPANPE